MQTDNPDIKPTVPEEEMNTYIDSILDTIPVSDVKLMEIKEAPDEDPVCQRLRVTALKFGQTSSICMMQWNPIGLSEETSLLSMEYCWSRQGL